MEPTLSPLAVDFETRFFAYLTARDLVTTVPERLIGGRSNHVWRSGDLVIKLYSKTQNNPLFDNDPEREQVSLVALSGTEMVPHLMDAGTFEGRQWLAYQHIKGDPWQEDTGHVAQLLGRLHDQPGWEGLPRGCNGSAELAAQTRGILARCRESAALLTQAPSGQVPPLECLSVIHGDPVPGNLLAHDGTLTLIDWQCPQMGDPAEDLGLFLSPAMQFLYRGAPLTQDECDAFLAAYPDPRVVGRALALMPWFHWRMSTYCLWKSEQGSTADSSAMALELAALQSINPSTV